MRNVCQIAEGLAARSCIREIELEKPGGGLEIRCAPGKTDDISIWLVREISHGCTTHDAKGTCN